MNTTTDAEKIEVAIEYKMGLTIDYTKADGEEVERKILPFAIDTTSEGHMIVRTYDFAREAIRSFRLDRLNQVDAELFDPLELVAPEELTGIYELLPS
jgi:predicted DNA-binding transcriptional regulator YafY